ncbi:hypothetical protein SCHPADRAFT_490127 [Schizopora paradoxa]|uniref:Uncharacterized protein n=1 Tax=Schizopora paradoxa TaxID=27342 RepID=A0A0H2S235_9AGAM|nr:hypothetical protein SCHPADRAFT_490127 [Schizopora paradoxa]
MAECCLEDCGRRVLATCQGMFLPSSPSTTERLTGTQGVSGASRDEVGRLVSVRALESKTWGRFAVKQIPGLFSPRDGRLCHSPLRKSNSRASWASHLLSSEPWQVSHNLSQEYQRYSSSRCLDRHLGLLRRPFRLSCSNVTALHFVVPSPLDEATAHSAPMLGPVLRLTTEFPLLFLLCRTP